MKRLSVILEDSIMQKSKPLTAGCKMLGDFTAPVTATVVTLLEEAGVEIKGRAGMDEFGICGIFGDLTELTESVSSVLGGKADAALCNDYTGALSLAAAARGLYYIQPAYGTVSRYGLVQCVPSIDQIGVLCRDAAEGFYTLKLITGYDEKDSVMIASDSANDHNDHLPDKSGRVVERYIPDHTFAEAEPEYCDIYHTLMQILCCAEFANCISRYDGIKSGYRAEKYTDLHELYTKSRTEGFGRDAKLAAIIGAMVLSQDNYTKYYEKAMKLRGMIKKSLKFDEYDVIIGKDCKAVNLIYLARLCGLPAVTTPEYTIVANAGREDVLVAVIQDGVKGGDKATLGGGL